VIAEVEGGPELLGMAGADPAPSDADIEAALDGLGVEAPDDKTFIVHLNTPATYFLSAMTLWVFVPLQESWITSANATEAENYVSSGPFMLQSWDHNAEIVLVPNPNWYGDVKPTLTEVRMPIFADLADVQRAYEADEVDAVLPIPSADVQRIKGDPAFADQYAEVSTLSIAHYNFNTYQDPEKASYGTPGPTKNLNFRIALVEAIDKVALRDATFSGLGVIANSFVMPGIPGYDETIDPYPYNPESAQEHMALALEELGVASAADLPPLRFGFNTGSDHESRVAFLAEAWRTQFGLQTDQIGSEFSVFLTQRTAGEYDISRNAWGADYPHANNQLSGLWTCGGGNNDSQWCSPEFDALLAKAAAEPDQTAQADLYKQAQALMMNDAPFIPLIYRVQPQLKKAYISSIDTPVDHQNPGDVFMESIQILKH
jgi:oligopeptide transport system substrate-binding protein